MARTRQSVLLPKVACSYGDVVVTMSSSPCTLVVLVVTAVSARHRRLASQSPQSAAAAATARVISAPRMMSLISDCVRAETFTLFFFA